MHSGPVYLSLIGRKLNEKWPLIDCIDGFIYFLLPNRLMLFLLNLKKVQKVASTMRIFDKTKTPSPNPMPSSLIFLKQFNNGRSLSYLSVLKILVYKCVFGLIQKLKIVLISARVSSNSFKTKSFTLDLHLHCLFDLFDVAYFVWSRFDSFHLSKI